MRQLFIIAGPNGSGKTTASLTVLPEILHCKEFVNADEIAKGLSPFNPEGVSFAFETTLSTKSYISLIRNAHMQGYNVTLVFFYLPSAEQAIMRVAKRVSEGGHNIPSDVIVRRYKRGLENLQKMYMPICDNWIIYNNCTAGGEVKRVASGNLNSLLRIDDHIAFNHIMNL